MGDPPDPHHHANPPATLPPTSLATSPYISAAATSSHAGPTTTSNFSPQNQSPQTEPPLPLDIQLAPKPTPTFASILKQNRDIGNGSSLKQVEVVRASKVIFTHEQALTVECAWGICLIGFIFGRFPGINSFNEVRAS